MTDNVDRFNDAIGAVEEAARAAEQLKRRILGEDAPDEKEGVISIPCLRGMLENGPEDIHFLAKRLIDCLQTIEVILFDHSEGNVQSEAKKSEFEKTSAPVRNAGIQNSGAQIQATFNPIA